MYSADCWFYRPLSWMCDMTFSPRSFAHRPRNTPLRVRASSRVVGQAGFSLVELMVAIVLGLILMTGVINVYIDSKRNYSYEDEQARLQENGRFALNFIKRELQHAGFFGGVITGGAGATPVTLTGTDCATDWATNTDNPLEFINNFAGAVTTINGTNLAGCLTAADIVAGTDIFTVKRTAGDYTLKDGEFNPALAAASTNQLYLRLKRAEDIVETEFVYLGSSGTIPVADATAGSRTDFWEYQAAVLYIRDYSNTAADGIPTLCAEVLRATGMVSGCLVEGIEDMQIELGIDSNGDGTPDQYKTNPVSADLGNVVAARIYLLVRSINTVPGYINSKTYNLGSTAVAAKNDGFMRNVYSTTVQVRNIAYAR